MRRMRGWALVLAGGLVVWNVGRPVHAETPLPYPHVRNYDVTLDVQTDGRLVITEVIGVDFGSVRRHGIYRRIPVRYSGSVGGLPTSYQLRLRRVSVTDPAGRPYRVRKQRVGGAVEWRIGDPDRYVQGRQTYVLRYEVQRGLLFLPDHDELYWNCIGHDWEWPMGQARCTVVLPEGIDPSAIRSTFYTGTFGSREPRGRASMEGRRVVFETGPLAVGEGLTVVVGWPKGVVRPPAGWQNLVWWMADNWELLLGVLLPPWVGGFLFLRWWRHGRDPRGRAAIVPQYRPPAGLTPAEVGVLLDERADPVDITATVIDLAVRGYLRIREETSQRLLIFKNTDYVFEFPAEAPPADALKDHERVIYMGLQREAGRSKQVRLSDLKEKFYFNLQMAQDELYKNLTSDGYFAKNPKALRSAYAGTASLLFVGSGILFVTLQILGRSPLNALVAALGVGLAGLLFWIFGRVMPRKTARGVQALEEILGFREFIRRVEADRLERLLREDPTLFDRVLPYALVFGVADEWAEKFQGLLQKPPDWYESPAWTVGTFRPQAFMNSLSHSVASMNSVFPSSPSRSSGSGSRSGFGGGGFSGGGRGGGGGGGW